jgi:acetyl-CoA carboxylase alpha subunit/acetyl-CoA carboxylase beta subunit
MERPARDLTRKYVDPDSFVRASDDLSTTNPLGYPGYGDIVTRARAASGCDEAVLAGRARISGNDVELAVFNFRFMAGSMGEVAGERVALALERAARRSVPAVLIIATGGARLQEGLRALAQMPKVVAARVELAETGTALIVLLEHPTTGGVLASIGGLGDVTAAVEGGIVAFAGPRLVQRFTGLPPSAGSHTAESALDSGLVDALVGRAERDVTGWLRATVEVLAPDRPEPSSAPPLSHAASTVVDAWAAVEAARAPQRPTGPQLLRGISDFACELRGDRAGGDDPAIVTTLARIGGRRALVIATDREYAPGPRAYRKVRRTLAIADRLRIPVVTIIDMRGANPSDESERGGIAWEIAGTIEALMTLSVPVAAVVTGEGGSGGAIALAVGDVLVAYESSVFSVLEPEAAAEVLWRDATRGPDAATMLKLTAPDLLSLGLADALVDAPLNAESLRSTVTFYLDMFRDDAPSAEERTRRRRDRWRRPYAT